MVQEVILFNGTDPEQLGMLPYFIDPTDKRKAREQFDANYQHGGGWRPIEDFRCAKVEMADGQDTIMISYPGDPPLFPLAVMYHQGEAILFFPHALVGILQNNGSIEVARMD
jgi:hypothetical protein